MNGKCEESNPSGNMVFFNLPSFDLPMLSVYRNIDWCSEYLDWNRKLVAFLPLVCNLIMICFTNRLLKGCQSTEP